MNLAKLVECFKTLSGEPYNLKGVRNNADCHEFLAVVTAVHHERICQSFYDWALCFAEAFCGVSAGGVWDVGWSADVDVVAVNVNMTISSESPECPEGIEGPSLT